MIWHLDTLTASRRCKVCFTKYGSVGRNMNYMFSYSCIFIYFVTWSLSGALCYIVNIVLKGNKYRQLKCPPLQILMFIRHGDNASSEMSCWRMNIRIIVTSLHWAVLSVFSEGQASFLPFAFSITIESLRMGGEKTIKWYIICTAQIRFSTRGFQLPPYEKWPLLYNVSICVGHDVSLVLSYRYRHIIVFAIRRSILECSHCGQYIRFLLFFCPRGGAAVIQQTFLHVYQNRFAMPPPTDRSSLADGCKQ